VVITSFSGHQASKDTPRNSRRSGVMRVLSAKKSQQHDRSSQKTPVGAHKEVEGGDFTQLHSRRKVPVSLSSPVLASGGKRARKSSHTSTQGSWLFIFLTTSSVCFFTSPWFWTVMNLIRQYFSTRAGHLCLMRTWMRICCQMKVNCGFR